MLVPAWQRSATTRVIIYDGMRPDNLEVSPSQRAEVSRLSSVLCQLRPSTRLTAFYADIPRQPNLNDCGLSVITSAASFAAGVLQWRVPGAVPPPKARAWQELMFAGLRVSLQRRLVKEVGSLFF